MLNDLLVSQITVVKGLNLPVRTHVQTGNDFRSRQRELDLL